MLFNHHIETMQFKCQNFIYCVESNKVFFVVEKGALVSFLMLIAKNNLERREKRLEAMKAFPFVQYH